jgi:hypothetical protein
MSGGGTPWQRSADAEMSVWTEILQCVPSQKGRSCSALRNTREPRTVCRMIPRDTVAQLRAARG